MDHPFLGVGIWQIFATFFLSGLARIVHVAGTTTFEHLKESETGVLYPHLHLPTFPLGFGFLTFPHQTGYWRKTCAYIQILILMLSRTQQNERRR